MPFSKLSFRGVSTATLAALALLGSAGSTFAIDRAPFAGGFVSDAPRGYGSSSAGYGAERQYYGAETVRRPHAGYRHTLDSYGGAIVKFDNRSDFEADEVDIGAPGEEGFVTPFGLSDARSGIFPGFESGSGGGVLYLDDQAETGGRSVLHLRPNVIDVEKARLDRQPIGPTGIAVTQLGTAKIIRIAGTPGGGDVSPPAAADTGETARAGLAPWSEAWERYCTRAHRSFDAERGTYTDADGASRFCTGD